MMSNIFYQQSEIIIALVLVTLMGLFYKIEIQFGCRKQETFFEPAITQFYNIQVAIDWFFFNYMRSHCPEMQEPVCEKCAADPVCAHRKQLFQPVFRTSFY